MKNLNIIKNLSIVALLTAAFGCSQDITDELAGKTVINATIDDPNPESRSCVDGATAGNQSFVGLMWQPDDKIGMYGTTDKNVPFKNESTSNSRKTTFSGQTTGMVQYAYFPYSEANNGREVTNLTGTLPEVQAIRTDRTLEADYKVGAAVSGSFGVDVKFNHILSLIRMQINGSGSTLSSEELDQIEFTATRGGQPVGLSGDFTFSAVDGSLTPSDNLAPKASAKWETKLAMSSGTNAFMSMLPVLKAGDELTITLLTTTRKVTFKVTLGVDLKPNYFYNFPLNLSVYESNADKYGWTNEERPTGTTPDPEPEVVTTTGTFTCASMNVDGLPIGNTGGPGSSGTKTISSAIAVAGWDFFGVSEDFAYDKELKSALSDYNYGTHRGNVSVAGGKNQNTDGLNFFWKNGISAANEKWVKYNDAEGDLFNGADEYIQKGFRHYEVTVVEGVVIDVYITHMNTYSGSGNTESNASVKAVLSQLRQVRDYIVANAKKNKRPAIFMGDTNMRYTRHDIKTNLIDALAGQNITFNDPWVDFHRGGVFPAWNNRSLMILSKFKGDKTNDIACCDDQRGEVVDKIWYFNVPGAPLQLEATNQYNDVSDKFVKTTESASYSGIWKELEDGTIVENTSISFTRKNGIADHFPVVADFKWTLTTPKQ